MKVCGLDEVGRGALAGPLVGAAIVLKPNIENLKSKLRDSKKLNRKQRETLVPEILNNCKLCVVSWITVEEINKYGIGWANKEVFYRLIKNIDANEFIVDGNLKLNMEGKNIKSVIKADGKVPEVMAASIVAKVSRDTLMGKLHFDYLNYGWNMNVGYGTIVHRKAIKSYGLTSLHRSLFVRKIAI